MSRVLVGLAGVVQARDAERGDDRERERQGNEREAQRTDDGKVLHKVTFGSRGTALIVPAGSGGARRGAGTDPIQVTAWARAGRGVASAP